MQVEICEELIVLYLQANLHLKSVSLTNNEMCVCVCVLCVLLSDLLSFSVSVSNEVWRRKLSQILSSVFSPSIPNQQANSIPNLIASSREESQ